MSLESIVILFAGKVPESKISGPGLPEWQITGMKQCRQTLSFAEGQAPKGKQAGKIKSSNIGTTNRNPGYQNTPEPPYFCNVKL